MTKIIYDEFGVSGLAIYEKSKGKFLDLHDEIRGLNNQAENLAMPFDQQTTRDEQAIHKISTEKRVLERKRMVEQMIIDKHLNLMKSSLKQDIL